MAHDSWPTRTKQPQVTDLEAFPKPKTPDDAVHNGIKLLDERAPGWRARIDPTLLDITFPYRCILGQLYATAARTVEDETGYDVGRRELGLDTSRYPPGQFGFAGFSPHITHESLNIAWRRALT